MIFDPFTIEGWHKAVIFADEEGLWKKIFVLDGIQKSQKDKPLIFEDFWRFLQIFADFGLFWDFSWLISGTSDVLMEEGVAERSKICR